MEILKELVKLLPPKKTHQIEVIGQNTNSSTKMGMLYHGILEGKYKNDSDASQDLYNRHPGYKAYRKLKGKLKDHLFNTLFFIDFNQPKFSDYQTALCNSYQQFSLIKILLNKAARSSAISIAEHLMKYTQKCEITELNLMISADLRNHYASLNMDEKRFEKYDKINKKAFTDLQAENMAAELYNLIFIHQRDIINNTLKKDAKTRIDRILADLKKLELTANSYRFLLYYTLSQTILLEYEGEHEKIIEVSEKALEGFRQKDFPNKLPIYIFTRRKLLSNFSLLRYEQAIELSHEIEKLLPRKSHNFLVNKYYQTLILVHLGSYTEANNIKEKVFSETNPGSMAADLREHWLILEAYLEFLRATSKIEGDKKNFRLQKFLNEVPIYNKEKRGRNISILILQLLFMLVRQNYGQYIDRMDALKQYSHRYLRKDDTFRSNCFIKMLRKISKLSFHPVRINAHVKDDLRALKKHPLQISQSPAEVEIIPYETLWEIIIEVLEHNLQEMK